MCATIITLIIFLVFLLIVLLFLYFVFVLIKLITSSILRLWYLSTSKIIGLAPRYRIGLTVAIKVKEGTITSVLLSTPKTFNPKCIAEVPEFKAIEYFAKALCQIIDLGVEVGETAVNPNAPLSDPMSCDIPGT